MDYQRAFNYFLEDSDWIKKMIIGGVLLLFSWAVIPVIIVLGYAVKVAQNVKNGNELPLPEWDWNRIADFLVPGLMVLIITFIYSIPAGIITVIAEALHLSVFSNLISLLMVLILIPATANFINVGTLGAAFDFEFIKYALSKNTTEILITALCILIASFIASLGVIGFFIGVAFTSFLATLMTFHLIGQIAKL